MKTLFASAMCLFFSTAAFASRLSDVGGGFKSLPKTYSVSENFFKEKYLQTEAIKDLPISLKGEWSNAEVYRLTQLLKELDSHRPTREAAIREFTEKTSLVFKKGETADFSEHTDYFKNPGVIYGVGVSSITALEFTLPMDATDSELIAMISAHMPHRLIKDQERLDKWQRTVARTRMGSFCSNFLEALGLK